MRLSRMTALLGLSLAAFTPLSAPAATFGIVPQAGLAGYGATVEWGFNKYLALSAGYTFLDQGVRDVASDEATYDGDVSLRNPQVFLRWAPFGGHFRLAVGLINQRSAFDLVASQFTDPVAAPVQSIQVRGDFGERVAPAITVGWESPIDEPGLGYHLSAGALYAGQPDVTVTATCKPGSPQPACDAYTASERRQIERDLERYQVLPILQAGLIYRL